ncbi:MULTISPECIES: RHS repeat domain-containing protein [Pseudomonas]|uniref:RHS repeat domain-containing protein n=1 Tax=Pseudomonas TaxID=286 RepID=UPI001E30B2D8|nr:MULTISPECIES: RHS repeat-associated core domain-containing protein [Pseudomonas]MCD4531410.1 RHS repeat protein [Pseudomonas sp. C3-2018]
MNSVGTEHIHTHTPTLTVIAPRGLPVRSIAYCRSVEAAQPEERINRSAYDAIGRLIEQWDPRLWAMGATVPATPANLTNRHSLSGKVLGTTSVDAGERISLFGDGDQLIQTWDSRETERRVEYDDLLRPLAVYEQGKGQASRCTERYEYADASADFATHNQCGQVLRHDDPAGTQTLDEYALIGGVLEQTQRFLRSLETPDWPQALSERDALLESVAQAATSATHFNPLGDVLEQTDAKGNRQLFDYTVDGLLLASHLQLSGQATSRTLVSDIAYNAYGQVEQETAGNGVVSTLTYRAEDGRLLRLRAGRDAEAPLQDLRYAYDPVGNVLSIEDAALPIRYFANQRVEPINCFDHDSLYQLIKATGWEAGSVSRGPQFDRFEDPRAVANYQQTYHYDTGGNLLELVHTGPQSHSRKLTAARYSNRCLADLDDRPPTEEDIAAAFDGNGNLLVLQPGQAMSWDLRNQLREVRPVERESADDDSELYLYDGDGQRRRKVRSTQTNARSLVSEVRYLPGLEIRTHEGSGEVLQVICVQAGRSTMQVLHWETAPPSGISNDQYRYNLTDHLGSSSLELDSDAEVISQETYHPFGGTAWFAGRSEVEASYKTVRYSGKERDATGLYYYGFRYYASWLQRWVNPDPIGIMEGLNLYRMVSNNPLAFVDVGGLMQRRFPVIPSRPSSRSGAPPVASSRPLSTLDVPPVAPSRPSSTPPDSPGSALLEGLNSGQSSGPSRVSVIPALQSRQLLVSDLNTKVAQSQQLSDAHLSNLNSIFKSRLAMTPLKVVNPMEQIEARPNQVLELQRDSTDNYHFLPTTPETKEVPAPHGSFIYVILADDPGRIYSAASLGSTTTEEQFRVHGHTSISRREDVLYAGHIILDQGKLESWNNGSGHYTPPYDLHQTNLIPAVQLLLPSNLFIDYRNMNQEQLNRTFGLRGYLTF